MKYLILIASLCALGACKAFEAAAESPEGAIQAVQGLSGVISALTGGWLSPDAVSTVVITLLGALGIKKGGELAERRREKIKKEGKLEQKANGQ